MHYNLAISVQDWLRSLYTGLSAAEALYRTGGLLFLAYFLSGMVILPFFRQDGVNAIALWFAYGIALVFTAGVFVESYYLVAAALRNTYVRVAGAGLIYCVYKFAEISANRFIADVTAVDPCTLPEASSLLSLSFLPYIWLWVAAGLLLIYISFCWVLVLVPAEIALSSDRLGGLKYVGRIVGVLVVLVVVLNTVTILQNKQSLAFGVAKVPLLKSEYYRNRSCVNLSRRFHVADIGRGNVSVYDPAADLFSIAPCKLGITSQ